ncbi:tripartite motif-containing protein 42 isoform 2-T2 [Morphnus guianensis]
MDENGHPCSIWPCCSNCCYPTCHSRKEECCSCWLFLFTSEQNCSCFPCPYEVDKPCQCCHCSCAEHANCWWCCCSCSNDPDCKCCCCGGENSACQYYESKCCRSSVDEPHCSRTPGMVQSKDVMSRFRTRNNASVITPERNVSSHAFRDQLACPLLRQGADNDLMEVILLKNNFKTYKDTKRKEIRNGFLKLHMVLHEQEKEMIELLENIELKKQKEISEYINYTSSQLSYMDGLIQYSKEALKEESQVVFLQSAHCLVKEIENAVPSVFQPSPHLREDPLKKIQPNFDDLFSILQGLVPSLSGIKQSESKAEKYAHTCNPEIMVPRHVSTTHESKQETLFRTPSLNSLSDLGVLSKDTVRRQSSTPRHHSTQSNEVCAYRDTACETPRKERKYQIVNFSSPEPINNESVPGPVVIYQTVVYLRSAKIYWTCPTEDVDFFEVEFYEVAGIGPDNVVQTKLAGQLSKIQQQNLEIHNLDPNTEYLFKVRAVNASGQGEWSEIYKIITSDDYGKIEDRWEKQKSIQGALHTPNR